MRVRKRKGGVNTIIFEDEANVQEAQVTPFDGAAAGLSPASDDVQKMGKELKDLLDAEAIARGLADNDLIPKTDISTNADLTVDPTKLTDRATIKTLLDALPSNFLANTDTFNSFAGLALQVLRVNAATDAVEAIQLAAALVAFNNGTAAFASNPANVQEAIEAGKVLHDAHIALVGVDNGHLPVIGAEPVNSIIEVFDNAGTKEYRLGQLAAYGEWKGDFAPDGATNPDATNITKSGDWLYVTADGDFDGVTLSIGQLLIATVDNPSVTDLTDWRLTIARTDLPPEGTQAEIELGTETALRLYAPKTLADWMLAKEMTQPEAVSTTGADYTKFSTVSTERLDQWGMSRRVRRVFNASSVFDFTALGYADKTAVYVRNTDAKNGLSITYGAGGTTNRDITQSNGESATVAGQDTFNLQPGEIAFMEKDGATVYISVIPGKRTFYFNDYALAAASNNITYDGLVVIRDKGEIWGRRTNQNTAPFPASGVPNDDWFKHGAADPQTLILNYIDIGIRSSGTNAGSNIEITFVDNDGNDYPDGDWVYSANLVQYAGGSATIITDKALYTGIIGVGRNKAGTVKFYYIGSFPNGLSEIRVDSTVATVTEDATVTYQGTNYSDDFAAIGDIIDPLYWTSSGKDEATDQAAHIVELTEYTAGNVISFREPDAADADYGTLFNWQVLAGQTIADTEVTDTSIEAELIAIKPKLERFGIGTVTPEGLVPDWKPLTEYTAGKRFVAPMPINADFITNNGAEVGLNYIFQTNVTTPDTITAFDDVQADSGNYDLIGVYRINGTQDRVLTGTGIMLLDPLSDLSNTALNEYIHWTTTDTPQTVRLLPSPAFVTTWKDYTGSGIAQPTAANEDFILPANSQMWVHRVGNAISVTFESNEGGSGSIRIFDSIADTDNENFADGEIIMTRSEGGGAVSWIFELNATEGDYGLADVVSGYFNKLREQTQAVILEDDGGIDEVVSFSQQDANFGDFVNDLDPTAKFYYVKRNATSTATQSFESGVTTVIPADDFDWYLFRRINETTVEFMGKPFSGNATHTVLPAAITGNYDLDVLQQNTDYYQAVGGGATVIGTVPYTGFDPTNDLVQIEYQGNEAFGFQTLVVASATQIEKYVRSRYSSAWGEWTPLSAPSEIYGTVASNEIGTLKQVPNVDETGAAMTNADYVAKGLLPLVNGYTLTDGATNNPKFALMYPTFVSGNDLLVPTTFDGDFVRNLGGNAAAFMVSQADEIQSHNHAGGKSVFGAEAAFGTTGNFGGGNNQTSNWDSASGLKPLTSSVGGSETRPENFAMQFCLVLDSYSRVLMVDANLVPVADNLRIIVQGQPPSTGNINFDVGSFVITDAGEYEWTAKGSGRATQTGRVTYQAEIRDAANGAGSVLDGGVMQINLESQNTFSYRLSDAHGQVFLAAGTYYYHANRNTGGVDGDDIFNMTLRKVPKTVEQVDPNLVPVEDLPLAYDRMFGNVFNSGGTNFPADTFTPNVSGNYNFISDLGITGNQVWAQLGTSLGATDIINNGTNRLNDAQEQTIQSVTLTAGVTYHITTSAGGSTSRSSMRVRIVNTDIVQKTVIKPEDVVITQQVISGALVEERGIFKEINDDVTAASTGTVTFPDGGFASPPKMQATAETNGHTINIRNVTATTFTYDQWDVEDIQQGGNFTYYAKGLK